MTLGRKSLALILAALCIGAVWVRLESLGGFEYPYFKGDSGTNFRYAHEIAGQGALPAVDKHASRPEGYSPARVKPMGVEYFTGFAYRLVQPFSDVAETRFAGVLTVLVFSLSVLTIFALSKAIWECQAAGVYAAFLTAFSAPLIRATDGIEYLHTPFAFVLVSLHLAVFVRFARRPSLLWAGLTGLVALALFGVWGSAGLYVAVFAFAVLFIRAPSMESRRWILSAHFVAVVFSGIAFPHLRASHFIFTWAAVWVFAATLYAFLERRLSRRVPGWIYVVGGMAVLTFVTIPLQSGGTGATDPLSYWFYRIRYLSGKPADPSALPDAVRLAWTLDHAPPRGETLIAFFLPLLFLLIPAAVSLRALKKEKSSPIGVPLASVAVGIALFILDRGAVFSAALVGFPFIAGALKSFSRNLKTRMVPVLIGSALVVLGIPPIPSRLNPADIVSKRLGLQRSDATRFTWVSIGNADRDLVRFLVTRTSTRSDVVLAPPEISSVVAGFAGRATVVAPGVYSREMSRKTVETLAGFYGDEKSLYERCETLGVTYVLYSIDILLDSSPYAPRYLSKTSGPLAESVAYRMHFSPETLRHFQLLYENDNYRLFRVTLDPIPVFLSDHPPVYQKEILRPFGSDFHAFYARIVDILSTYQTAVEAQVRGDEEGAIRRFRHCLDQAPFFTKAWVGTGDSFLRLGHADEAFAAYNRVLEYAPDDTHALYYGALSLAYQGRKDEALRLVTLLMSATGDQEIRRNALELKSALESGRRIEMPRQGARDSAE